MPIDDAMDNLEVSPKKKKRKPRQRTVKNITSCKETFNIFKQYIHNLVENYNRDNSSSLQINPHNLSHVIPHMRFGKNLKIKINSIKREEFFSMIRKKNKETYELITSSDMKDLFSEKIDLTKKSVYWAFSDILNLAELLSGRDIVHFSSFASNNVYVSTPAEFSLFMKYGQLVRSYMSHVESFNKKVFFTYNNNTGKGLYHAFTPFTREGLLEFIKKTGEKNISEMIKEVKTMNHEFRFAGPENIVESLYDRLKKYNPQLIYKEPK